MYFQRTVSYVLLFACLLIVCAVGLANFRFGSSSETARSFSVTTEYFGANAREIERVITVPIEDAIGDIPGIKSISSSSEFGKSRVMLTTKKGCDMNILYADIKERIDRVRSSFPRSVQKTQISSSDATNRAIYIVAFRSKTLGKSELGEYVDGIIKKRYERIRGTGDIEVAGCGIEDVMITVDPDRAAQYGLDSFPISDALQKEYVRIPVGSVRGSEKDIPLFFDSGLVAIDDFKDISIRTAGGNAVKLSEIAGITRKNRFIEERSRIDGEERIILYVHSGGSVNELSLCEELGKTTHAIAMEGLETEVIYDKGSAIMVGIRKILISMAISMITLFLFIGAFMPDLRSRILLSASIPFSIFLGISALSLARIPIDASIISGLTIGSGLIIDNYLIIHDYLRADCQRSIKPISMPLLTGTLTTLIVFLPLFALRTLSVSIQSISLSLCGMLILSQFLTFTFLPLPLRLACKAEKKRKPIVDFTFVSRPFFALTDFSLRWKCPLRAIYAAIILSVPMFLCFGTKEFTPVDDDGILFAHVEFPSGTTIGETDTGIIPYVKEFKKIPGVKIVESNARRGNAQISVTFDGDRISSEELQTSLEGIAKSSVKGHFFFGLDQNTHAYKIRFTLTGGNHIALREKAREIGKIFSEKPWVRGVVYHFKENPPSRVFVPDTKKLADHGLYPDRIASILRWNIQGPVTLKWIEKGKERDVRLSSTIVSRSLDDIGSLAIPVKDGAPLTLSGIGEFHEGSEPEQLYRDNRQNSIGFTILTDRLGLDEIDSRITDIVSSIELPTGYGLFPDASLRDSMRDYRTMFRVFLLAIFLIYVLLAAQNESFALPLLIISAIPFSAFFPLMFLFALHKPITIASIIGVIILSGTSVNNYILITDSLSNADEKGLFAERICAALASRFNPLFLSSGTSVIASFPILFSSRLFSDFPSALAIIITLGILGSFLGSFLFLPAIVEFFIRNKRAKC